MIKYFFQFTDIIEVNHIRELINKIKQRLHHYDFNDSYAELYEAKPHFESIKQYAIETDNEELANAQYITSIYLRLLLQLSNYFHLIQAGQFRESWDILQNCFDSAFQINRHTIVEDRFEVLQIIDLLTCYECLYPYKFFCSSEMVIEKSECSICGKPSQDLSCPHIKGRIYWGEVATEKILKVKEYQAVAIVRNPADKRCVLELSNDTQADGEKFGLIYDFLKLQIPVFQLFSVDIQKLEMKRSDIIVVGRNEKCSCKSGKKFKTCCGKDLYYNHYQHNIILGETISFQFH